MKRPNKIEMGVSINSCNDCHKNNIGTAIFEHFVPKSGELNRFIKYKDGNCYINEQVLMSIIRMVNPHQKDRKIMVVSHDEFKELLMGKGE